MAMIGTFFGVKNKKSIRYLLNAEFHQMQELIISEVIGIYVIKINFIVISKDINKL
jgi:hypothetical protein